MAYITQTDLENALSPQTISQIFDDNNTGTLNTAAIAAVCDRASAEVDSWLVGRYKGPFPITQSPLPMLIKAAALDFGVAYCFERHPEYVRTFGEEKRAERWKRAMERLENISEAVQRIPDLTSSPKPSNVGGLVYDTGTRFILDSLTDTAQGDF